MKKIFIVFTSLILILFSMGCSRSQKISDVEEEFYKSGENDSEYVELTKVDKNIWIHTTYIDYHGSRAAANGLVVRTSDAKIVIPGHGEMGDSKLLEHTAELLQDN